MDDERPGQGHNQPPVDLFNRATELVKNANRWRTERQTIVDEEMAGAAARFIAQLRAARDDLRDQFTTERKPFDDAIFNLRQKYNDPLALIDIALNAMVLLNTDWLRRKRDRLEDEKRRQQEKADAAIAEAARLSHQASQPGATVEQEHAAAEAEERAAQLTEAALDPAERAQVRDDQTARAMSLRSNWQAVIVNDELAINSYRRHPDVRQAILTQIKKTATREAKLQKDPTKAKPGIEYVNNERAA
jgi:hypothetical protein